MKFAFWFMVRSKNKLSLVFRLSPVCSKFKFKFFAGIQLFGLKTTSHGKSDLKNEYFMDAPLRDVGETTRDTFFTTLHGKPDLKNSFFRSGLPCEVVFRPNS